MANTMGGMKLLYVVCRGTSYSMLMNMVLSKLPLHQKDCDVKLKTHLSLFLTEKFLHIIESNEDVKVAFYEYVTGVTHMVMIYVSREDKYILMRRSKDGEAEPFKGSTAHGIGWAPTKGGQSYCGKCVLCTK